MSYEKHVFADGDVLTADDVNRMEEALEKVSQLALEVKPGEATLKPGIYYQFGEVSALAVELEPGIPGYAPEYVFEFTPKDGFAGLTISPDVTWLGCPQFPTGKRCLVSVCMGLAVMGCG